MFLILAALVAIIGLLMLLHVIAGGLILGVLLLVAGVLIAVYAERGRFVR